MTENADPMEFLLAVLMDSAGTDLAGIGVRVGRIENADVPPVLLLEDAGWRNATEVAFFTPARISITAYGRTEAEAALLYRAATDLLPSHSLRVIAGIGSGWAFDETGPQPRDDPDTRWPARFGVAAIYMPTVVLVPAAS